jgi:hypothetical protein
LTVDDADASHDPGLVLDVSFLGFEGLTDAGEPVIVIVADDANGSAALAASSKYAREMLQVERYQAAVLAAGSEPLYTAPQAGSDPPDFWVTDARGREVGLEVTSFTIQQRRTAFAIFEATRRGVLGEPPVRFRHLAGWDVFVTFDGSQLPHRRDDGPAAEALLDALLAYRPTLVQASFPLPEKLDLPALVETPFGASLFANPAGPTARSSPFYAAAGFNLRLSYSTTRTTTEGWQEIERLVASHDRPRVDHLLISSGAPDRFGAVLAGEAHLLRMALDAPRVLTRPKHIRRVTAHDWETDRISELLLDTKLSTPALGSADEDVVAL